MSRIGSAPIAIPNNVEVNVGNGAVVVKGPKGELTRTLHPNVEVTIADDQATVSPKDKSRATRALWGTFASHIANMVQGVTDGFEEKLIIEGVGYRAALQGSSLVLNVGFSHPVSMEVPDDITVSVEKEVISISGINKDRVGQFAASVRAVKKPEPYKGKGIRYQDEVVRRKQGKKA